MGVKVQFELSTQPGGNTSALSDIYGPFDFAHIVDDELRVGPEGDVFATIGDGGWQLAGTDDASSTWTNVILFAVANQPPAK